MKVLIQVMCAAFILGALELLAQETGAPAVQGSALPAKGVPAMQEVQATGTGATEDEAFKQAVVDAVRQVVGTLVSAENVVSNEKVIKDEVLTLSNGFVEKVLNQDKTKVDDGTWQVKLKCIVRKGQLYGKLRGANIPTIKFEGESLFADVVSQLSLETDAAALLRRAILAWNGNLYEAVCISGKPEIVTKSDKTVTIRMACRVTLRRTVYENQFLAGLTNLLQTLAIGKVADERTSSEDAKIFRNQQQVIYVDGVQGGYLFTVKDLQVVLKQVKTDCFGENAHANLRLFAIFRDSANECLHIRSRKHSLQTGTQATRFGTTCHITPRISGNAGEAESDSSEFTFDAELPLESLAKITKIELHVATKLDEYLTYNALASDAPGGFLYCSNETGWLYKFQKPSAKRNSGFFYSDYLPTLQMTDQSLEFRSQKR